MRLLRSALLLCGLIVGLGVFTQCAPDNLLIQVTVNGLSTEASELQVDLQLNGQSPPQRMSVINNLGLFAISLPNQTSQRGMLTVNVLALTSDKCKAGSGTVSIDLSSAGPSYAADLTMNGSSKQCTLSINVMGQGSITVAGGQAPASCSGQCDYEVMAGTQITLSPIPTTGNYLSSWLGQCATNTSASCQFTLNSPLSAGASFAPVMCSPDKWCQVNLPTIPPQLNGIWGSQANDIWAVGAAPQGGDATILHYNGINWTPMNSTATGTNLLGVWGTSATKIFAIGDGNNAYIGDGNTWASSNISVATTYRGIWGSGPNSVWVVGPGGRAYRYTDSIWAIQTSVTSENLNDVFGVNATTLFAVGSNGTFLTGNGADNGWAVVQTGGANLNSVWASSSTSGWAVGDNGTCWQLNFSVWTMHAIATTQTLHRLWGSDANHIWAVGDLGTIVKWDGTAWSAQQSGTTSNLYGIWGTDPSNIWAVGADGVILHYQP